MWASHKLLVLAIKIPIPKGGPAKEWRGDTSGDIPSSHVLGLFNKAQAETDS